MSSNQQIMLAQKISASYTYATWNSSDKNSYITLSNGNLTATASVTSWQYWLVRATIWKSSWKWYWEITHNDVSSWSWQDWIATSSASLTWNHELWYDLYAWCFRMYDYWVNGTGDYAHNNSYTAFTPNSKPLVSDVFWYALDMDNWTLKMYKNNVLQSPTFTWLSWTIYPMIANWNNTKTTIANFWATTMTYTAPSWYNQWLYN